MFLLLKYLEKSLKLDLKIDNVYTLYSHDEIFQWYTSYTDQKLKPNQVKIVLFGSI